MTTWSYAIETQEIIERWSAKRQKEEVQKFQVRLNEWGKLGWEMVGFESVPLTGGFTGNIKGYVYLTFLKNPKSD